jgi:hypothetical protein
MAWVTHTYTLPQYLSIHPDQKSADKIVHIFAVSLRTPSWLPNITVVLPGQNGALRPGRVVARAHNVKMFVIRCNLGPNDQWTLSRCIIIAGITYNKRSLRAVVTLCRDGLWDAVDEERC